MAVNVWNQIGTYLPHKPQASSCLNVHFGYSYTHFSAHKFTNKLINSNKLKVFAYHFLIVILSQKAGGFVSIFEVKYVSKSLQSKIKVIPQDLIKLRKILTACGLQFYLFQGLKRGSDTHWPSTLPLTYTFSPISAIFFCWGSNAGSQMFPPKAHLLTHTPAVSCLLMFLFMLGIQHRISCMLTKCSSNDPHL